MVPSQKGAPFWKQTQWSGPSHDSVGRKVWDLAGWEAGLRPWETSRVGWGENRQGILLQHPCDWCKGRQIAMYPNFVHINARMLQWLQLQAGVVCSFIYAIVILNGSWKNSPKSRLPVLLNIWNITTNITKLFCSSVFPINNIQIYFLLSLPPLFFTNKQCQERNVEFLFKNIVHCSFYSLTQLRHVQLNHSEPLTCETLNSNCILVKYYLSFNLSF